MKFRPYILALSVLALLAACDAKTDTKNYPQTPEDARKERLGKLTGDEGLSLGGAKEDDGTGGNNPLGVNSFLWRATIDTLAFMPLASADPFGGVVLTDWYEDPNAQGERYKVNALILDRRLSAGSLKITVFRQKKDDSGSWVDAPVDATMGGKLEDTVLTRARQLRVRQLGY
jgi:hypothetical protein